MNVWYCVLPAAAGLVMVGCDTMSGPIEGGSFDPLVPPGADTGPRVVETREQFKPGQIGAVSMNNAGFFNTLPRGSANPDRLLNAGSQVKIISAEGSYLKVELDDGKVGYVPSIMVEDPRSAPSPNEVQVYPPLQGTDAVPIIPLTPGDPTIPQTPATDALPSVIEPDAPADQPPAPPPVPADLTTPPPPIQPDAAGTPQPPAGDAPKTDADQDEDKDDEQPAEKTGAPGTEPAGP